MSQRKQWILSNETQIGLKIFSTSIQQRWSDEAIMCRINSCVLGEFWKSANQLSLT